MPSSEPKFKIAICGGGIAGAALAYMINHSSESNISVQIYENAPQFGEIGAGLTVWPRSLQILDAVGLKGGKMGYERYATFPPPEACDLAYDFRKSDTPEGFIYFTRTLKGGLTSFHRAHLLDLFASAIPPETVHFDKRLVSFTQLPEGVLLNFADGSSAEADMLVGADGINSVVRKGIIDAKVKKMRKETPEGWEREIERMEKGTEYEWTRTIAYRYLVDIPTLEAVDPAHLSLKKPQVYCGYNNHVVTYPIDGGRLLNVVDCYRLPDLKPGQKPETYEDIYTESPTKQELADLLDGWEPAVETLLQCIGTPTRWPTNYLSPINTWCDGRAVIVGDAAHAMAPHNASGAGMAIEDAFVLSTLLNHSKCTFVNLPLALKAFEKVRIPPVHRTMHSSEVCGYIYQFVGKNGHHYDKLGAEIESLTSWLPDFDVDKVRRGAIDAFLGMLDSDSD